MRDLDSEISQTIQREFTWWTQRLAAEDSDATSEREAPLTVRYRDKVVGHFRVDLLVAETIIVEVKTADKISAAHERQTLNYLRESGLPVGLILNAGPQATVRRMIRTRRAR